MRRFRPPSLRISRREESERHATWLELFYDLVFVIAVAEVVKHLELRITLAGFVGYLGLFVPVWWAWVGHTIYANRFDTDDIVHRGLTFLQMLAAVGMAVNIEGALGNKSAGFAVAYIVARATLVLCYMRARRHVAQARGITSLYIAGFGIGMSVWVISLWVPPPERFLLWLAGLAIDFATPWLGLRLLARVPVDTAHMPERFGLFTIIVLGESVMAVVVGISEVQWQAASVAAAVLGFMIAVGTWWIYFIYQNLWRTVDCLGGGQPYIYGHLPVYVGITMSSVGIKHAIISATSPLSDGALWLFYGGVALWLSAIVAIQMATVHWHKRRPFPWPLQAGAIVILLLGASRVTGSGLAALAVLTAVLIVTVGIEELRAGEGKKDTEGLDARPTG